MGARGRTAGCYGVTGVLNALWGATLPATDARLDLGAGRLGGLLMALAVGALVAMPVAGRLADRWTGQRLLRWTMPSASLALALTALAPSAGVLTVSAVVLGMLSGALNVALSLQAVGVERATGRPVMATMHGTWTLGAVFGGALVTAGLHVGVDVQPLLLTGAAVLFSTTLTLSRKLHPVPGPEPVCEPAQPEPRRVGLVVGLGVVGASAFLTEGAATDWAGVHATRVLGATPAVGSLVYTAFFVAMTVVRFAGDPVRARLGPALTIRIAGGTATAGYGLVLLAGATQTPRVGTAIVGWVLAGAGMAVVWPVVVSALGTSGASARRLSTVTTISYGGGLVGPALIGSVAGRAGLPTALLIPAALAVLVAAAASAVLNQCLASGETERRTPTMRST
ncbi:putative MFS family arabinose efflux permease [Kribbella orskensis]|uniref:MFS family arabinose efflux permease n=1 Tax=Kribbella orskensis TaxID=2512216 RepID=A0ABY2B8Q3_9ACTN|nr:MULTISPECIES: MFS transporter [Kribbella]TCN31571.1 putative MFS family arabinose efflux permease [Kribbella sp. VKM Ac-2500]TCO11916.1 putative MFS family arabinose efflux permease [Kribbella orskensis]